MMFLQMHQVAILDLKEATMMAVTTVQDERRNYCMAQVLAAGEVVKWNCMLVLLASCAVYARSRFQLDCVM